MARQSTTTSSPRKWRPARAPRGPDSSSATSLLAVDGRPVTSAARCRPDSPRQQSTGTPLHYTVLRLRTQQMVDISVEPIPSSPRGLYFMLAAGRHLLAAGRRVRAAAPSRSPGDAAFLLADRRVLRRARLLVHRPARSARLGLLLGGRDGAAPAAAAVPALRARLSGSAGRVGAGATPGARCFPLCICRRLLLGGASVAGVVNAARHGDVLVRVADARSERRARLPRGRAWSPASRS